ncbi:DUF802 domain-containing protein [Acidovorax sp. A79]|uniref:DUF802 domain-containing protein n=1 Tax=Acidovorax sp. A79 TaxID=3056107 RepID=UPI0034E86AD0
MNKSVMAAVFALGLAAVGWVGGGFVGSSPLALAMTVVIGAVYVLGALELVQFRRGTVALATALADGAQQPLVDLGSWLDRLPAALRHPVRQRIEGERAVLPGPALTPYLVGLLVMLGMLGTFLGMVVTFKGAVFALETSGSLEGIRAALAEPIKGLGLSFGTSVAGVAASAMLGLMSAIARRERLVAVRQLDAHIPTVFRPFSASHRREETFQALQAQAQAMPLIAERLQGLVEGLERRHDKLAAQLLAQQKDFHGEASSAYTRLAGAVGASLHDSLGASARVAGETLRPVVEQAMAELAQESQRAHQRLADATAAQMQALAAQWEGTARQVSDTWTSALDKHTQVQDRLMGGFDGALQSVTQSFEQRSAALHAALQDTAAQSHAAQKAADEQRLAGWTRSMEGMGQTLAAQWERAGTRAVEQQQGMRDALEGATARLDQSLLAATQAFEQRSTALVASLQDTVAHTHAAQAAADEQRIAGWRASMEDTARSLAAQWERAGEQAAAQQRGVALALAGAGAQLGESLQSATQSFDQRSSALLSSLQDTVAQSHTAQMSADQARLAGWNASMEGVAQSLTAEWQRVSTQTLERQQAVCDALETAVTGLAGRMGEQVAKTLDGTARLMDQSEALLRTRTDAEAQWLQAQGDRMDALAGVWRTELAALRDAEAERGRAAVDRLEALQEAVAQHLATLGSALEAPLTRLLQTASDVPQAAAEVIAQLRHEMTQLSERDNVALAERTAMMEQLGTLLQSVNEAAVEQRGAIESLVGTAASVLEQAASQFAQALDSQVGKADEAATHVAASAVELSSLGEAFGHGVGLFTASNEKLMDSLQRIEGAIGQSLSRSDEQLAYYVAQAREVIDLSIASQQGIVEDLRRLKGRAVAAAEPEVAG